MKGPEFVRCRERKERAGRSGPPAVCCGCVGSAAASAAVAAAAAALGLAALALGIFGGAAGLAVAGGLLGELLLHLVDLGLRRLHLRLGRDVGALVVRRTRR